MTLPAEVKPIVARLNQLQDALRADFVDRDEVVRLLVLAAVCHEHLLLLGPPGTAKTELVNRFADLVRAKRFHYQLTRFTEPTELFGPMDLARFQQGEYHIVTTNMLPEAQIAFLDEVFQGSSAILNTLLTLVNERVFFNGAKAQLCPLIGLIGASNTLPDDPVLRAFADRFLLRALVEPVEPDRIEALLELGWQAEQNRVRAAAGEGQKAAPLLDAEHKKEFDVLQRAVAKVDVRAVRPAYADAVRELRGNGVEMSDRRVVRGLKLVAGAALLRGSMTAAAEDLWPLRHCWTRPEEVAALRQVLGAHLGDDRAAAGPERPAAEVGDDLGVLDDHAAAARREGQVMALLAQYNTVRREVLRDHPDNGELRTRVERGIARLMDTLARLEGQ